MSSIFDDKAVLKRSGKMIHAVLRLLVDVVQKDDFLKTRRAVAGGGGHVVFSESWTTDASTWFQGVR